MDKPISNVLELRVDSLVLNKHKEVHRFTFMDFMNFRHPNMGGNYGFYPIPLTEEWLIKLGFIKMPVNGYTYLLKISAATLQCRCNGDKWYFQFNETYFGEMFSYVHQVQNFCASLGKELINA